MLRSLSAALAFSFLGCGLGVYEGTGASLGGAESSLTASGEVRLNELLANEPGSTEGAEFVELVNLSGDDVDLSGWTISDSLKVRHVFPPGVVLPRGEALVVYAHAAQIPASV